MNSKTDLAKYGSLTAVCIEWLSLLLFYSLKPQDFVGPNPVSYFATQPETRFIFTICYLLAAASFWLFIKLHLSKRHQFSSRTFAVSMVFFALVAIIPYNPSSFPSAVAHNGAFFVTAVTFMLGIIGVARATRDRLLRISSWWFAAVAALLYALLLVNNGSHEFLYWEVAWWLSLQLWMIWVSLHGVFQRSRAGSVGD